MPISREDVIFAYKFFLMRPAPPDDVIAAQSNKYNSIDEIRSEFMSSIEFAQIAKQPKTMGVPVFLLPESDELGAIRIQAPTLYAPQCQMPTYAQFQEPLFQRLRSELGATSMNLHRKGWEWVYIARVLELNMLNKPGKYGLCFAAGCEPVPAFAAAGGANVLATDAPEDFGGHWSEGGQFATGLTGLQRPQLIDNDTFAKRVEFRPVDMNEIPVDLMCGKFDFLWSSCALEHLGSIRKGMDFVHNAMRCLKPGGIAIHTTELNLSSNETTHDGFPTCFFRRRDLEALAEELAAAGHEMEPLNFFTGAHPIDAHIDHQPFTTTHMKAFLGRIIFTSFGLIIRKLA